MTTGLVPSINNVNGGDSSPQFIELDPKKQRWTRLRKNLGVAAKLLSNSGPRQPWMLTLTYADAHGWKPDHIRDALRLFRAWCTRSGFRCRYIWVMETKARKSGEQVGIVAPHYHLVVWLPHGVQPPYFDARGWWPHGLTNQVKAVAAVRYVMKYASKFDNDGELPHGARIYGIGGLSMSDAAIRRWINWPSYVQGNASVSCRWTRRTGGGFANRDTGEVLLSEWGLSSRNKQSTRLMRLRSHPRVIESPVGPFSWVKAWHNASF